MISYSLVLVSALLFADPRPDFASGVVVDSVTNKGIAEATVWILEQNLGTTDAEGHYEVKIPNAALGKKFLVGAKHPSYGKGTWYADQDVQHEIGKPALVPVIKMQPPSDITINQRPTDQHPIIVASNSCCCRCCDPCCNWYGMRVPTSPARIVAEPAQPILVAKPANQNRRVLVGDPLFASRCPLDTVPLPEAVTLGRVAPRARLTIRERFVQSAAPIPERIRILFADDVLPRPTSIVRDDRRQ